MEIGWIGTGIMGAPMARRLIDGGHRVRVFNRSPEKARALAADGATVAADPAACVAGADVVFIMVPDTPDVEATVAKIEPALKAGQLVIDMSTVSPAAERTIAARLKAVGVEYLDAPVSGGDVGARDGTLAIMVGGDAAAFERARPLFELIGKRITTMGPSGAGQMTKLANQIAVAINLEAAAEAIRFAQGRRSRRVARGRGDWRGRGRIVAVDEPRSENNSGRLSARVLYQADSQGPAAGDRGGARVRACAAGTFADGLDVQRVGCAGPRPRRHAGGRGGTRQIGGREVVPESNTDFLEAQDGRPADRS